MTQEHNKDRVYFVELDVDIGFSTYEPLLQFLSAEKRDKILKFHFDIDKKLSVASDLFIRYLACQYLNVNNSELRFGRNEYGKPFLVDVDDFHYNISHTRNAITVGVSQTPIGVDVERIRGFQNAIVKRFFSKKEKQYVESDNENSSKRFYEIWTKKEAYVKWIGEGLSIPLRSFDVLADPMSCCLETVQIDNYAVSICRTENRYLSVCSDIKEESLWQKWKSLC